MRCGYPVERPDVDPAFALPIIQSYESSALGHTPKPDGAMEGFGSREVLYDCYVGAPHRGL